ncbi:hypothetical protein SpCBS45565_g01917 [Spizellomyces sp. 'palustris']|nr:hypothetical protein SpCBS45565_g01917 [Spizellomyces sp. 'palustris']
MSVQSIGESAAVLDQFLGDRPETHFGLGENSYLNVHVQEAVMCSPAFESQQRDINVPTMNGTAGMLPPPVAPMALGSWYDGPKGQTLSLDEFDLGSADEISIGLRGNETGDFTALLGPNMSVNHSGSLTMFEQLIMSPPTYTTPPVTSPPKVAQRQHSFPSPFPRMYASPAINIVTPESTIISTPYQNFTPDPVFSMDSLLNELASPAAACITPSQPLTNSPVLTLLDELESELKYLHTQDTHDTRSITAFMSSAVSPFAPPMTEPTLNPHSSGSEHDVAMSKLMRALSIVRARRNAHSSDPQNSHPTPPVEPLVPNTSLLSDPGQWSIDLSPPVQGPVSSEVENSAFNTLLAPLSYDALKHASESANDSNQQQQPQPSHPVPYPTPSESSPYPAQFASPATSPALPAFLSPHPAATSPAIHFLSPYSTTASPATTFFSPYSTTTSPAGSPYTPFDEASYESDGVNGILNLLNNSAIGGYPETDTLTGTSPRNSSPPATNPLIATRRKSATSHASPRHNPSQKTFKCTHEGCGKVFTRMYNLKSHAKAHTGERPYACPACPITFLRKHDMRRHYASLHDTEKAYRCPNCGSGFARTDALKRHMEVESRMGKRSGPVQEAMNLG